MFMLKEINKKLNEAIAEKNTIYVLKGFNSIISHLKIDTTHIINLEIDKDINNLFKIDNQKVIVDIVNKLSMSERYYCLLEELIYIAKNNLLGLIETSKYNIKIIDIGIFDYYYPGIISNNIDEILAKFDEDSDEDNIFQTIYSEFDKINNIPVIAYNSIELENKYKVLQLFRIYSNEYIVWKESDRKSIELFDTSNSQKYIEIFNKIIYEGYNTIVYNIIEDNNKNIVTNKFLYLLNNLGINIETHTERKKLKKPESYNDYLSILRRIDKNYDFKDFKIYKNPFLNNEKIDINQSVIIDYIYENIKKAQEIGTDFRDIFVTAPTGAGKSILFQIPAVIAAEKLNLVTIVISPLIGLMKDQVNNLKKITNIAQTINSEYTPYEKEIIKEKVKEGQCSILYISPETLLGNYDIKSIIGERKIGLLVVDEAHTVSTWGKNFRPDYWYLGEYINRLRHRLNHIFPIATFTATSTISKDGNDMYHDIIESLNMTCEPFLGDVKRYNIKFDINICKKDHAYKEEKDIAVINKINRYIQEKKKTIVYFPFVKTLNNIYESLPQDKVSRYFGKLDKNEKDMTLEDIKTGERNVVLATKAFGMGIDVKGITDVYHFAPTGNLSDYVQEIGRAARDPNETGVAATDYFEEDFRYINKLYGLSRITNYHIIGVLKKILDKYKKLNRRNFLVSTDDFAHIFSASEDNDENIEASLKATIIAIKRDFKSMSNYVPLVFKPRSMYTKGLFYIPDVKLPLIEEYNWNKYLTVKYDSKQLENMNYEGVVTKFLGKVYEFDFKSCWEEKYNGKYDGLTFGNFKRKFFENELENRDRSFMHEKMILTVETKHGNNLETVFYILKNKLNCLKLVFDEMKMSTKHFSIDEIVNIYSLKDNQSNKTFIKRIIEPIINLIIAYSAAKNHKDKFCDYNTKTDKYHIKSATYDRKISEIQEAVFNYIKGYENTNKRISIVDSKDENMRNDPLIIAVQLMELFDIASYNFEAGNKPEFFVRVNSEETIRRVIDNSFYSSQTLKNISNLHYNSVNYMKYFFEKLDNDDDRWQFIEDYFLGNIENNPKYNIKKITKTNIKKIDDEINSITEDEKEFKENKILKIYNVLDDIEKNTIKYYINENKINELEIEGFRQLTPNCELARKLSDSIVGNIFTINGYNYMLEKIEYIKVV